MTSEGKSTATLLDLIRAGDQEARERLLARYLGPLRRWAHARLPGYARGTVDTDDLVQVTLLRALNRLDHFEPLHEGAFLAYLRRILVNCIRDEVRRSVRHPDQVDLPASQPAAEATPLDRQRKESCGRVRPARDAPDHTRRRQTVAKSKQTSENTGFMKPVQPDDKLAAVVGNDPLPRTEITKRVWAYIKERDLQDPNNRRIIRADEKLGPVFDGRSEVDMFEMTKLINQHVRG